MDFRELEYFVAIAKEKNLTRAAESLYVSQPTLTKFIQRLEAEQGLPLFLRVGKQLKLSYAGTRFLHYAEQLLMLNQDLENEINDIKKMDIGMLHVGMPPFRCSFALPAVLPRFHKLYPNVGIEIMEDSSSNLDSALIDGTIDLAFFNLSEPQKGLRYEKIRQDQIFAILPKNHPVSSLAIPVPDSPVPGIRLEWLMNEVFLLQKRTQRQGQYLMHVLKEKNITPKKIMRNSNIRATASLAASGYGVAFLSGGLLQHFQSVCEFDYYALLDVNYPINFVGAWREGNYLPGYASKFIEIMKEVSNS